MLGVDLRAVVYSEVTFAAVPANLFFDFYTAVGWLLGISDPSVC